MNTSNSNPDLWSKYFYTTSTYSTSYRSWEDKRTRYEELRWPFKTKPAKPAELAESYPEGDLDLLLGIGVSQNE